LAINFGSILTWSRIGSMLCMLLLVLVLMVSDKSNYKELMESLFFNNIGALLQNVVVVIKKHQLNQKQTHFFQTNSLKIYNEKLILPVLLLVSILQVHQAILV